MRRFRLHLDWPEKGQPTGNEFYEAIHDLIEEKSVNENRLEGTVVEMKAGLQDSLAIISGREQEFGDLEEEKRQLLEKVCKD